MKQKSTENWKDWPPWKQKAFLDQIRQRRIRGAWAPCSEPQRLALESEADYLFFGGAGGGGKTDLLIGAALTRHQRSIIFRKEFTELEGLESRCEEILGTCEGYNGQRHLWKLNLVGQDRRIEFGACSKPGAAQSYRGRAHDAKFFDEVTQFKEAEVRFICSWLRTTDPSQRCRVICAGNPPLSEPERWVIRFWAPWIDKNYAGTKAKPGELRWFVRGTDANGRDCDIEVPAGTEGAKSRTFIPSSVYDNPYLIATGYDRQLGQLPEPLRSALLHGRFDLEADEDDPWQVIPSRWARLAQQRWTPCTPDTHMSALGVDVARGGQARTVLTPRYGFYFAEQRVLAGHETPDGASVVRHIEAILGPFAMANIDATGVGGAVIDAAVAANIPHQAMNGGGASTGRDRSGKFGFANQRAEWYWGLREILNPELHFQVQIPPDPELFAELCAQRWKLTLRGIQLVSKDDLPGESPDKADSLVYAYAGSAEPLRGDQFMLVRHQTVQ